MRILELQEYAKTHGFDNLRFTYEAHDGQSHTGQWLDAYLGFFRVDGMKPNEMVTVKSWRDIAGDSLEFQPITEDHPVQEVT